MKRIRGEQLQTTTLLYLKKRNFTDSEATFRQNLKFTSSSFETASGLIRNNLISNLDVIAMVSQNLDEYFLAFNSFKNFVNCTIKRNKYVGLKQLVCPIFVHAYLDLINAGRFDEAEEFYKLFCDDKLMKNDSDTIIHLQKIKEINDLVSNTLIHQIRNKICQVDLYPEEKQLLIRFLHEQDNMVIMKLLNDRFCFVETENAISKSSTKDKVTQEASSENAENSKISADDNMLSLISPPSCPPVTTPSTPQVQLIEKDICNFDIDENLLKKHINSVTSSQPEIQGLYLYKFIDTKKCLTNASISHDKHMVCTCRDDSALSLWKLSPLVSTSNKYCEVDQEIDSSSPMFPDVSTVKFGSEFVNDIYCHANKTTKIRREQLNDNGMTTLLGHCGPVYSSAFSHNDKFLLSSSEDTSIRLWDTEVLKNTTVYQGHSYPVVSVAVSPMSFYFASSSMDRTCRLWTFERNYPIRIFAGHEHSVESVAFHGNASYIASSDNTVRLWDVNSGKTVRLFVGHWAPVTCLAFSGDGKYLASSGEDCRIRIWDIASGSLIKEIRYHTDTVYSLNFSPDSCLLASCGADATVCIWTTSTTASESETLSNNPHLHEIAQWKFQDSISKLLHIEFSGDILHCVGVV